MNEKFLMLVDGRLILNLKLSPDKKNLIIYTNNHPKEFEIDSFSIINPIGVFIDKNEITIEKPLAKTPFSHRVRFQIDTVVGEPTNTNTNTGTPYPMILLKISKENEALLFIGTDDNRIGLQHGVHYQGKKINIQFVTENNIHYLEITR